MHQSRLSYSDPTVRSSFTPQLPGACVESAAYMCLMAACLLLEQDKLCVQPALMDSVCSAKWVLDNMHLHRQTWRGDVAGILCIRAHRNRPSGFNRIQSEPCVVKVLSQCSPST